MLRFVLNTCWTIAVLGIIGAAVFLSVARLTLPLMGQYREGIEQWINASIGQPAEIGKIDAAWHGLSPAIKLEDVRLLDKSGKNTVVKFTQAEIEIDLLGSLRQGRLEPGRLTVIGADLSVVRKVDGSIAVIGLEDMHEDTQSDDELKTWLLTRDWLSIEGGRVQFKDQIANKNTEVFSEVNVTIKNYRDRHQLIGQVILPAALGRNLHFAFDITGDVANTALWEGNLYLKGQDLKLDRWLAQHEVYGVEVANGIADMEVWGRRQQSGWDRLAGNVAINNAIFTPAALANSGGPAQGPDKHRFTRLGGRFLWQKTQPGWFMNIDQLVVSRNNRTWTPSAISLRETAAADARSIMAKMKFLRIEDITPLLSMSNKLDAETKKKLQTIQPQGEFNDAGLQWIEKAGMAPAIKVSARVNDLGVAAHRFWPGFQGVDGRLFLNGDDGALEMDTRQAKLNMNRWFRAPLSIRQAKGKISWQHKEEFWELRASNLKVSNEDINFVGGFALRQEPEKHSPFLDLAVKVVQGSSKRLSRYLPAHIMPDDAVEWLDKSILDGKLVGGGMVFRGRINEFPFANREGRFEARLAVDNGRLRYAAEWPTLDKIRGEIVAVGRHIEVKADSARTLDAEVVATTAIIDDVAAAQPLLTVEGRATGPAATGLAFLTDTTLRSGIGKFFTDVQAQGPVTVNLDLNFPLANAPAKVNGSVELQDNRLALNKPPLQLDAVTGVLLFTDDGLSAQGITASFLGERTSLDIRTSSDAATPQALTTTITAASRISAATLSERFAIPAQDFIQGSASWRSTIQIGTEKNSDEARVGVQIESPLIGLAIKLPEPLHKNAESIKGLTVQTELPWRQGTAVSFRYGNDVTGIFALGAADGQRLGVQAGEIRVGGEAAEVPERPGIRVKGQLNKLNTVDWEPLLELGGAGSSRGQAEINEVDLAIKDFSTLGRRFSALALKAKKINNQWAMSLTSDKVKGAVTFPNDPLLPITLDFDYLYLEKPEAASQGDPASPDDWRPINLKCRNFRLHGLALGEMTASTIKVPDGLKLTDFALNGASTTITAKGDWVKVMGQHYSSFNIGFSSKNVGKTLSTFGYADSIADGKGSGQLTVYWQGSPAAFAFENLNGGMTMRLEGGRLLEVDPGAGRIFGLLSLQALPRRLTLDFSDLFAKGFAFDTIEGQFSLREGNAYTDNLIMEGPAARIEAQGRIGLASKDYDQQITVIPHLTSSIPLAIGVTTGSPVVGIAAWFAEKILHRPLGRITQTRYTVTGDWDQPVIQPLTPKTP